MKRTAVLLACICAAIGVTVGESSAVVDDVNLSLSESSPYEYVSGRVLYYAPTGTNSGSFTVTATVETDADVDMVEFPSVFGSDDFEDSSSPYSQTYSWTSGATANGQQTVKATDTDTPATSDEETFTVTPDTTAPTGHKVALSGGPGYGTLSVPLSFTHGTDSGAGVNSETGLVERASAPLSNEKCGTFGTFAAVTVSGTTDASVTTGNCYRYQYKVADNVGNLSAASTPSTDAKVDATPPSAPGLVFSGLTNAAASGSVVYFRATGGGAFTVSAIATDAESGIASYTFPTLAGFVGVGTGSTRTYSFSGAQSAPAGPIAVSATNGTGLSSAAAAFSLAADSAAPSLAVRCDGRPCRASAYPKGVTVTLTGADTGGSGVDSIRYTFDGTTPTADHGAEYEGPFVVRTLTRLKVRAYDRVGNPSRLATATIRSLASRFVFQAPARLSIKTGARSLSARVSSTQRAIVSAKMTGPGLKKPQRWQFILGSGASIVQLQLPKLAHAGRYTIVWTVQAGTRKLSRTTRVAVGGK